ncbi:ferritin-like fold-containing protein [Nitriliruptor alkaliphilus]|uniref:ferritin-like fold-containing protein n=1 Tax=Nitriliruptor alkaliphilus TaxID=427918 RepID=UPI0006989A75|nr:ferritin-like fold-containing protein [Nitriliruptor alkaliphilus]
MEGELELATVEVLGALSYGQLRSFESAARAIRHAPDCVAADQLAELAVREHRAYEALRDHLAARTDLATAVMDRQKPHFDAYFDRVPLDDWFGAGVFFAIGLPIAADFGRALAPMLSPETAVVVVGALADRAPFERFAIAHLRELLVDDDAPERARHIAADVLGRALTAFQGVVADTDALKVLVEHHAAEEGVSGEAGVKQLAITVLEGHRRRLVALGLEGLDEL